MAAQKKILSGENLDQALESKQIPFLEYLRLRALVDIRESIDAFADKKIRIDEGIFSALLENQRTKDLKGKKMDEEEKTYGHQLLDLFRSLIDHIAIDTGDAIRHVSKIEFIAGGEGYLFTLGDDQGQATDQERPNRISTEQAVKDMQDQGSGESPDAKIKRHLGALPPHVKTSRRLLVAHINSVKIKSWVIVDLAYAFGCRGDEVAARAADYLALPKETPENNGTASAEEEKNSGE